MDMWYNYSINVGDKNDNTDSRNIDNLWIKNGILLGMQDSAENDFYDKFFSIADDKKDRILIELQHFLQGNDYSIFINNVSVALANDYWAFSRDDLEIKDYLMNLAMNNPQKLLEIYEKINEISQSSHKTK